MAVKNHQDKDVTQWEQLGTQVPVGLRRKLKAACAADGREMREVVTEMITRWLAERDGSDDFSI